MINKLSENLFELIEYRQVLWQLTKQRLILRYRRTLLGYFWTLFNPLLMMTVTAVVFSTIFQADLRTYVVFLFAGMLPFNHFSGAISQSSGIFIENEGLLKKIYIPKILMPVSVIVAATVDSLLSFVVLMMIILTVGAEFSWALIIIPLVFLLLSLFSLGLALIISVITTFFRDLQHIVTIFLQALFFLSPILYDKTKLSENLEPLIKLNPLVYFIDIFRDVIYLANWPGIETAIIAILLTLASLFVGLVFFNSQQKKIIYRL